jgi:hypothetical protein
VIKNPSSRYRKLQNCSLRLETFQKTGKQIYIFTFFEKIICIKLPVPQPSSWYRELGFGPGKDGENQKNDYIYIYILALEKMGGKKYEIFIF